MSDTEALKEQADLFKVNFTRIREEIGKAIVGQERVIEAVLTALICGGNVLLEGVPGLGKTELVKTISKVLDLQFKRIQFTPDLMPADIIGTNILSGDEGGTYRMEFRQGPIFTQLLLADEINRATPKTQSALLETMQEGSVTVDRETYTLDPPFFVLATQNPLEQEGTYPLPEAQLDRFMFKCWVPYPDRDDLNEIVSRTILKQSVPVEKIFSGEEIMKLRETLENVVVADPMKDYAVRIVLATHADSDVATEKVKQFVKWGGSPRAVQALISAARVRALTDGRVHVAYEDVKQYAEEVLQHRVLLNYDGLAENIDTAGIVREITEQIPEEPA